MLLLPARYLYIVAAYYDFTWLSTEAQAAFLSAPYSFVLPV